MNEAKLEAIALIESIPDEKAEIVLNILENICELLNYDTNWQKRSTYRVEEQLAILEELENLVGEESDLKDG